MFLAASPSPLVFLHPLKDDEMKRPLIILRTFPQISVSPEESKRRLEPVGRVGVWAKR